MNNDKHVSDVLDLMIGIRNMMIDTDYKMSNKDFSDFCCIANDIMILQSVGE